MSLAAPIVKQFSYAIFASKNLDDPQFLPDQLGGNLASIAHIYTNGANRLVEDFARENGIPCTIHPLQGSNLFTSTHAILAVVDAAYIVADDASKSAGQIREMCESKGVPYKLFPFEPAAYWKLKVCRAQEILAAADEKDQDSVLAAYAALRKAL